MTAAHRSTCRQDTCAGCFTPTSLAPSPPSLLRAGDRISLGTHYDGSFAPWVEVVSVHTDSWGASLVTYRTSSGRTATIRIYRNDRVVVGR